MRFFFLCTVFWQSKFQCNDAVTYHCHLFLICRWASSAGGTKKLLRPKRAGRRMKIVGTGSRKVSELPMKTKAQSCDTCLLAYRSCSHIFHMWKKESSPDFSETPLMLCLYHSNKLGNIILRQPLQPCQVTGEIYTSFKSWTLNFGNQAAVQSNIYESNYVVYPQGKTVT